MTINSYDVHDEKKQQMTTSKQEQIRNYGRNFVY